MKTTIITVLALCLWALALLSIPIYYHRPHAEVEIREVNIENSTLEVALIYWIDFEIIHSEYGLIIPINQLDSLKSAVEIDFQKMRSALKEEKKLIKSIK